MPNTITLKDKAGANVVYTLRQQMADRSIYIATGASISENRRLELQVKDNGKTVRVIGKLSVPTKGSCTSGCSTDAFTEVGSFDLSSVKVADELSMDNFLAQFSSFIASPAVSDAYKTGV